MTVDLTETYKGKNMQGLFDGENWSIDWVKEDDVGKEH